MPKEIRLICDDCCVGQSQEEFTTIMLKTLGWKEVFLEEDELDEERSLFFCPDCEYNPAVEYYELNFQLDTPEEISEYEAEMLRNLQQLKEEANDNNEYGLDYGGF